MSSFKLEFIGNDVYADTQERYLGESFGNGRPKFYVIDGDFVLITFSHGVVRKIPTHRLLTITEK